MDANPRTVIVVAGGDDVDRTVLDRVASADAVIAADSGVDHALGLGLVVDLAVGDFDSVTAEGLAAAEASGSRIDRHPRAKDKIDLELALDAALQLGANHIVVIGGHGGRLDLFLANLLLLADPALADVRVEAHLGPARVYVIRDELVVDGHPGDVLTLLPVHGPALGVRTEGLRWPLRGEELPPSTSRGCSNEFVGSTARITLSGGTLLAVLPGTAMPLNGGTP